MPSYNQNEKSEVPTLGPDVAIDSGDIQSMRDESAADLMRELDAKQSQMRLAPLATYVAGGVLVDALIQL